MGSKIITAWHCGKCGQIIVCHEEFKRCPKCYVTEYIDVKPKKIKLISVDDVKRLNRFKVADYGTIKINNAQDYILIKKSDLEKLEGGK